MPVEIRRTLLWQQTTYLEGWKEVAEPTLLVAAMAIIRNPWFGRGHVENMRPEIQEHGPELGKLLTGMLLGVTGDFDSGELANNHICNITGAAGVVCQAPSGDTWGDITDGAIAFRGMRLTFDPTASSVDVDQVKFRIVADNVDVPEPATLALFGLALVGIGAARRRRRA